MVMGYGYSKADTVAALLRLTSRTILFEVKRRRAALSANTDNDERPLNF